MTSVNNQCERCAVRRGCVLVNLSLSGEQPCSQFEYKNEADALDDCIELWTWLVKTGKYKYDYCMQHPDTLVEVMTCLCPLCHVYHRGDDCKGCPLDETHNKCVFLHSIYCKWCEAMDKVEKAKQARRLLDVLIKYKREHE